MGDGIAHQLQQGALHHAEHGRIQPDIAAAAFEHHALAQRLRHVARAAFERTEQRRHRDQPQLLGGVAQLAQLALDTLRRRAQVLLDPMDGELQFPGQRARGLQRGVAGAPAPAPRRQLHLQPLGERARGGGVAATAPQLRDLGVRLRDAGQQGIHLGDIGAQAERRFVGPRPGRGGRLGIRRGRQAGDAGCDLGESREHGLDAGTRYRGVRVAPRSECVLDTVCCIGDLGLPDHPGRPFERMRQAQHARHHGVRARPSLELEHALAELLQQLARLDAEILEGVLGHALRALSAAAPGAAGPWTGSPAGPPSAASGPGSPRFPSSPARCC